MHTYIIASKLRRKRFNKHRKTISMIEEALRTLLFTLFYLPITEKKKKPVRHSNVHSIPVCFLVFKDFAVVTLLLNWSR